MSELSRRASEITIGELARRAGVATSTLRYYEREGLIQSRRTAGNQRRYPRDTLRRLAYIRVSQKLGIPLANVRFYLSMLPEERTPTRGDWARVAVCYRKEIDDRIDRLSRLRDFLTDCVGCGCLSLDRCELANPEDVHGHLGQGPRRLLETDEPALPS